MAQSRRLTLAIAQRLSYGDRLHDRSQHNADGSPVRWKVNGQPKLWKRDSSRVRLPLKHGLKSYDVLTESDFDSDGKCRYDLWTGEGI